MFNIVDDLVARICLSRNRLPALCVYISIS